MEKSAIEERSVFANSDGLGTLGFELDKYCLHFCPTFFGIFDDFSKYTPKMLGNFDKYSNMIKRGENICSKLLSKYFCTFLHSFKSEHCAHTMFSCALGLIRHHLS